MRRLCVIAVFCLAVAAPATLAQPRYTGPWDPAAEAAAERAVARLGDKRALTIRATIREIPGLTPAPAARHSR